MARPQQIPSARNLDRQEERPLAELAALTGVSRYTLAHAARTEALAARRLGSQYVTTLAAVDAWLKAAAHRPGRRPQRKPVELVREEQEGEALAA